MQHHDPAVPTNGHLRPIEFQRYVYLEKVTQETEAEESGTEPISPMTKLMSDEARQQSPSLVPRVEIYPKKFTYAVVSESEKDSSPTEDRTGAFILISKGSDAVDSLNAILKKVMPQKSSSCVRLWANHIMKGCKATHMGDGYELVQIDMIEVENSKNKADNRMTVEKWMERQGESNVIDLLVETRMNDSTQWARAALELENRIQVGDYVDAQDSAGKWYEAIIREVNEDSVTTHYSGWASKWNGKIRRRNGRDAVPGTARNAAAPAPLWTYTVRWRENIKIGQMVEVRDSTSPVHQPKWFRGYVRKIGKPNDKPRDLFGGARVEMLEKSQSTTPNGKGRPMLLLGRTQQILVEIPQEKQNTPALSSPTSEDDQEDDPPYLRWVNLYGEEICLAGTHMKIVSESKEKRPATINYEYDPRKPPVEVLKSHMHGAGFVRESLRGQPPAPGSVGLQNLGNSCFMNSIVQCLNHCEPLTLYFLREDYAKDLNRKNPLGSSGRVAMAYASLLSDIWGGQYSALAPRLLKTTIASFAPQFNNIYQHDSHEFCSFLMDGLHEDCNRVPSKPYVEDLEGFGIPDDKIAIESWRRHLLRHDSIIVDHCQGMHRSHVTCPICGRESIKFDVFSSISVPLTFSKDQSSVPLDDCLEKFTEGEQLDENNAWYCPSCQKHVCALKMLALWSVPDILIIHLKRFNYENRGGRVVRSKIEDRVVFPIDNLDMRPYILGPVDEAAPPIYNVSTQYPLLGRSRSYVIGAHMRLTSALRRQ
jgi:ubiquitin carboxyl-terminal hydrolase 8